jgi:hypothetical protein
MGGDGVSFDTETIRLMRTVLDQAVARLPTHLRTSSVKIELAELILKFAAGGERDPSRLGTFALVHVMERHRVPLDNLGMNDAFM